MTTTVNIKDLLPLVAGISKEEIALRLDNSNPLFCFSIPGPGNYRNYPRIELLQICIKFGIDPVSDYQWHRSTIEFKQHYAAVTGRTI